MDLTPLESITHQTTTSKRSARREWLIVWSMAALIAIGFFALGWYAHGVRS